MRIKTWNIEAMTGYKPITTFYEDFSIADKFGISAIKDTYKRGLESAKFMGYKELTELCMVLNWKIWEHCETCPHFATVYQELWEKISEYIPEYLKGEELDYYYRTID